MPPFLQKKPDGGFRHIAFLWVHLSLFVRHLLMLENFKNFEKFKTKIHNLVSEITTT